MRRAVRVISSSAWIVAASWFAADTVNALIGAFTLGPRESAAGHAESRGLTMEPRARPLAYFLDPIVRANVFFHGEPVPEEEVASAAEAAPEDTCTLPVQVLGAVVAPGSPELSVVTLRETANKKLHVVQVGDRALDQATLVEVSTPFVEGKLRKQTIAVFERDDRVRFVCKTGAPPATAVASNAAGASTLGNGIRRVSPTEYEIPQTEVDAVMNGGLATIATTVRVIPYFEAGKASGFKLYSIKPGSLLSKMGLASGDVLRKVNGYDISSPEKALEVYGILKSERNVTVDFTRGGKPNTFRYAIR